MYCFIHTHPFLKWDGGAAHVSSLGFARDAAWPFQMASSEDAKAILDRRERGMLLELFPDLQFHDEHAIVVDADDGKRHRTA